jgi:uncharacterized protein YqgC (DUF456 family)
VTGPLGVIALTLSLVIMFIGLIGTVVPVIPGTVLIFVAALGYALVEGFQSVGWPTLVILGLLMLVATTADIWVSSVGAKMGGASGWSVLIGLLGGLGGLVLFNLAGAIIGAISGVMLTEIVRLGNLKQALKAGAGWAVGWVLSTMVQLGIGLTMVAIFVWQLTQGP